MHSRVTSLGRGARTGCGGGGADATGFGMDTVAYRLGSGTTLFFFFFDIVNRLRTALRLRGHGLAAERCVLSHTLSHTRTHSRCCIPTSTPSWSNASRTLGSASLASRVALARVSKPRRWYSLAIFEQASV